MAEWRNGNRMAEMVEWRNGGMAGMAEQRKEWLNSRMAEMATYVLFTVHTDDDDDVNDDNDTLIFYSIDQLLRHIGHAILIISIKLNMSKEQQLLELLW